LIVDAGEADVGDLIDRLEAIGDGPADLDRGHLAPTAAEQPLLDRGDDLLDLLGGNGAFVAGPFEPADDLLPVKGHAGAVVLDDDELGLELDVLVGGEAFAAGQASAAAADGVALVDLAGVDDLVLVLLAKRTTH